MDAKKRKRDEDVPLVAYYTSHGSFSRPFTQDSLAEMHTLIRKKMSLGQDAEVKLSWKHDSERMALDDEDDFPGFSIYARAVVSVVVNVEVLSAGSHAIPSLEAAPESQVEDDQPPPKKRKKVHFPVNSTIQDQASAAPSAAPIPIQVETAPTLSKKRSKKNLESSTALSAAQVATSTTLATPPADAPLSIKKKAKKGTAEAPASMDPSTTGETTTSAPQPELSESISHGPKEKKKRRKGMSVATSALPEEPAPVEVPEPAVAPASIATAKPKKRKKKALALNEPISTAVAAPTPTVDELSVPEPEQADGPSTLLPTKKMKVKKSQAEGVAEGSTPSTPVAQVSADAAPHAKTPAKKRKRVMEPSAASSSADPQTPAFAGCHLCRSPMDHLRFLCPIFVGGVETLAARLAELKTEPGADAALIRDLEHIVQAKRDVLAGNPPAASAKRKRKPKKVKKVVVAGKDVASAAPTKAGSSALPEQVPATATRLTDATKAPANAWSPKSQKAALAPTKEPARLKATESPTTTPKGQQQPDSDTEEDPDKVEAKLMLPPKTKITEPKKSNASAETSSSAKPTEAPTPELVKQAPAASRRPVPPSPSSSSSDEDTCPPTKPTRHAARPSFFNDDDDLLASLHASQRSIHSVLDELDGNMFDGAPIQPDVDDDEPGDVTVADEDEEEEETHPARNKKPRARRGSDSSAEAADESDSDDDTPGHGPAAEETMPPVEVTQEDASEETVNQPPDKGEKDVVDDSASVASRGDSPIPEVYPEAVATSDSEDDLTSATTVVEPVAGTPTSFRELAEEQDTQKSESSLAARQKVIDRILELDLMPDVVSGVNAPDVPLPPATQGSSQPTPEQDPAPAPRGTQPAPTDAEDPIEPPDDVPSHDFHLADPIHDSSPVSDRPAPPREQESSQDLTITQPASSQSAASARRQIGRPKRSTGLVTAEALAKSLADSDEPRGESILVPRRIPPRPESQDAGPSPAPKRRGRPPLSQEVKDQRAAEKQRRKDEKAAAKARAQGAKAASLSDTENETPGPSGERTMSQSQSAAAWEVLARDSSSGVDDTSSMVDQLESTPAYSLRRRPVPAPLQLDRADETPSRVSAQNPNSGPLFNFSESQDLTYPYTQRDYFATQPRSADAGADADAENDEHSQETFVTPAIDRRLSTLSQIAVRDVVWASPVGEHPPRALAPAAVAARSRRRAVEEEAQESEEEDESSDGSGSDERPKGATHIPQNRRAGVSAKPAARRKKSALASLLGE